MSNFRPEWYEKKGTTFVDFTNVAVITVKFVDNWNIPLVGVSEEIQIRRQKLTWNLTCSNSSNDMAIEIDQNNAL